MHQPCFLEAHPQAEEAIRQEYASGQRIGLERRCAYLFLYFGRGDMVPAGNMRASLRRWLLLGSSINHGACLFARVVVRFHPAVKGCPLWRHLLQQESLTHGSQQAISTAGQSGIACVAQALVSQRCQLMYPSELDAV